MNKYSLAAIFVIGVLCALIYVSIQHVLRMDANDPQIQISEDTAVMLSRGYTPDAVMPQTKVDIAMSLAPFMIVYDKDKMVLASSGILDGRTPSLPSGVLTYVSLHGEDRFTWQPRMGVRIAAVVTQYKNGFVLIGRNLREVEKREDDLMKQVLIGWVGMVILASSPFLIKNSKKFF